MTRHSSNLTLCVLFIFLMESCSPCFYTPNAQNVPMLRGKKEGVVNASLQGGLYSRGLNIQTAFSVHDHIGLMMNYQHYGAQYSGSFISLGGPSEDGHFWGNFGEVALGYFLTFYNKWLFEVYGGGGVGRVVNVQTGNYYYYNLPYYRADVGYNRYFIQPAIGWTANEHFEIAFSYRFGLLHYNDVSIRSGDGLNIFDVTGISNNPLVLLEPAFTLRAGGKNVKFQYQATYSANFGDHNEHFDPFGASFAIFFRIHGKSD